MILNKILFFLLVSVIFVNAGCTQYAQKKSDKLYFQANKTTLSADSDNSVFSEGNISKNNDSYMIRKLRKKVDGGVIWAWKVFSLPHLLYPENNCD